MNIRYLSSSLASRLSSPTFVGNDGRIASIMEESDEGERNEIDGQDMNLILNPL